MRRGVHTQSGTREAYPGWYKGGIPREVYQAIHLGMYPGRYTRLYYLGCTQGGIPVYTTYPTWEGDMRRIVLPTHHGRYTPRVYTTYYTTLGIPPYTAVTARSAC